MDVWIPDLTKYAGPRYKAIADAIADAIERGRLPVGAQLPPHRDLAARLGLTVGTITRGYSEAERRGLIMGETGRGTFVREDLFSDTQDALSATGDASLIDLSLNLPPQPIGNTPEQALAATLKSLAADPALAGTLRYQPHEGAAAHRAAGAVWLKHTGLEADPNRLLVTSSAQHALTIIFATLAQAGDVVLTEALTDPGMKDLANLLRLRLEGLPIDAHGLRPDAFEAACRSRVAKLLFIIPTLHNPTTAVMPETRRREIAALAQEHNVLIVEDDVYGMLPAERPLPIAAFAPEQTFYVTSLAKCVAPGLRLGYGVDGPTAVG
jgi:DNA-binding transcriptional MocR family regulator